MAVLNFDRILLMLKDPGSIPRETLHSQDGLNLGDICFCPIRWTLSMQHISLDHLQKLVAEGTFMPPQSEGPPELSRTTAILLVFQADSQHEKITDVYMGLVVHRVKSCLYTPDQILDFVKDIEVNLQAAHNALKARGNPSKRCTFCLFVSNFGGTMSIPTDPPYCLVYPTSYVMDVEPDHFDTCNNLVGMHLCCCICLTTLQFTNDDPKQFTKYSRSHLILPRRAQYNDWLLPVILKLQNHWEPLIDSSMKEPFPMELVGDFRVADPIFKGCYGDSLLYSIVELHQLRWWGIHLPMYQGKIPMPPAPSYWQAREPEVTQQSPPRVVTPDPQTESLKTKHCIGKDSPHHSSGCSSNTSTPKCPDSTSAKKPSSSKEPALNSQEKSLKACGSCKHGHSPSPVAGSVGCKWKDVHMEDSLTLNTTLPISSNVFDGLCSPMGSCSNVTELLPPSITSTPLGLAGPRH